MDTCIFCEIVKHNVPSNIVLENDNFIAFYDINPVSKGHTLVIPKKHIRDFNELLKEDEKFIYKYLQFIENVRQKLLEKFKPGKGIRIVWNTENLIEVYHLHCHLIPVY